jgi:hypothetical protein
VRLVLGGVRFAGFSLQEEIADLSEESAASTLGTSVNSDDRYLPLHNFCFFEQGTGTSLAGLKYSLPI